MKNIEMKVEGTKLILTVDLNQEHGLSSSGKSITIASTEGNISVPEHEQIKMGVNIYRPRPQSGPRRKVEKEETDASQTASSYLS